MLSQSSTALLPFPRYLAAGILVLALLMLLAGVCPSPSGLLPFPQHHAVLLSHSAVLRIFYHLHSILRLAFSRCLFSCFLQGYVFLLHGLYLCHSACDSTISFFNKSFTSSIAPHSLHFCAVSSCVTISSFTISIAPQSNAISEFFSSFMTFISSCPYCTGTFFSFMALCNTVRSSQSMVPAAS